MRRRGGAFFLITVRRSRGQRERAGGLRDCPAHLLTNGATGMLWRSLTNWLSLSRNGRKRRSRSQRAALARRQGRSRWRRAFLEPLEDRSLLAATIIVN